MSVSEAYKYIRLRLAVDGDLNNYPDRMLRKAAKKMARRAA